MAVGAGRRSPKRLTFHRGGALLASRHALAALGLAGLLSACAGAGAQAGAAGASQIGYMVPESRPGVPAGYLAPEALPQSLALLPAPPAAGSAALAADEEVSRRNLALHGTARWEQAAEDANLSFPRAASTFACALDAPISEEATPHLYLLVRRSLADASASTRPAKDRYARPRPFLANKAETCTPGDEKVLAKSGSYPSGHAAVGWAWALILAELAPERLDALLARGLSYADSRLVCNVHWQSDLVEARVLGAGVVARLHRDPAFRADLEAAARELAAAREHHLKPARDCAAEAAALAIQAPPAP